MKKKSYAKMPMPIKVFLNSGLLFKACALIATAFIVIAVLTPVIAPYSPYEQNYTNMFGDISAEHWLGTDDLGRDVMSRLMYGARITLVTSLFSSLIAMCLGVLLGVTAGYFGGVWEQIVMKFTDMQLSIPPLILAMVLAALFAKGIVGVTFIIGISVVPTYARMIHGITLSIRQEDYIMACRLLGKNDLQIMLRHVLPNCIPTIIVLFTMNLGSAIMLEASLSYLGIGIVPPTPTWGGMVAAGYDYIMIEPLLALLPGICIILVVVAFNVIGDTLRDVLDPRLKGKL